MMSSVVTVSDLISEEEAMLHQQQQLQGMDDTQGNNQ